jgi:galactonate dehydratase
MSSLAAYAEKSKAPVCVSETLGSRWGYRDLLEAGVFGVINVDLSWCGGISEALKIAHMAETWDCPFTAHDCTGPWCLPHTRTSPALHPMLWFRRWSALIIFEWYPQLVTAQPELKDGAFSPPNGPGLGVELLPDLHQRADATVLISDSVLGECNDIGHLAELERPGGADKRRWFGHRRRFRACLRSPGGQELLF